MRVLVFEQWHLGHHYVYVGHLLPRLLEVADHVTLATTEQGLRSAEYREYLSKFEGRLSLDPSVPPATEGMPFRERTRMARDLYNAAARARSEYVLVPTGDPQTSAMALGNFARRRRHSARWSGEVGIHFGQGVANASWKGRLRDWFKQWVVAAAGWDRVHLVNLLFYEYVQRHGGRLASQSVLLPDPIAVNPRLSREESRRRLGIPEEGRYIGVLGSLDVRKAVRETLAAFRTAAKPGHRILLAGRHSASLRKAIQSEAMDLVKSDALVSLDRFLSFTELQTALTAVDLVCTPYPRFGHLSGILLNAVAAGRPVLANDYGWSKEMIRRFNLGWTCDVLDPNVFASSIAQALSACDGYRQSPAVERLLAFHRPENFAESWVDRIRQVQGHSTSSRLRPWSWVMEGVPAPVGQTMRG